MADTTLDPTSDESVDSTVDTTQESTSEQVTAQEQANFEAGLHEQVATVPEDEDPYAGLTPEQKEVRLLEEKASEAALAYKLAMDASNARKAEIAKQEKLLSDYYALIALITCGDKALSDALAINKQAILECLKDQRIKVGTPQPIPQHGSIGIHHSNNGSKIIDGSTLPEKKERKITPEIAAQCRYEKSNGLATTAELAARYGVKEGYMSNVLRGIRGNGRTA